MRWLRQQIITQCCAMVKHKGQGQLGQGGEKGLLLLADGLYEERQPAQQVLIQKPALTRLQAGKMGGFAILPGVRFGPAQKREQRQFIADVKWGDLDFLIVDSPPGTGDEPLTVAQTIRDAKAIIVTTPQEVSLADVRKSISFCRTVKMDILGLIENMSGFTCPHCNKAVDLFGSGGGEKTAGTAGIPFLGKIPFDPNVVSCGDNGISLQEKYADAQVSRAFLELAEKISK